MSKLSLCFPTFYYCAVKKNTPLLQYDAVSILLLGVKKDEIRFDSEIDITDTIASNYVKGKKSISKLIMNMLLQCNEAEIIRRLELLELQNISYINNSLSKLIDAAYNISAQERFAMKERKNAPESELEFIAAVFMSAVRCPKASACAIDEDIDSQIKAIRTPTSSETELYDISRAISMQHTRVESRYDSVKVKEFLNLAQTAGTGVMALDDAHIQSVFEFGSKLYNYYLTTFTGPGDVMADAISQMNFFAGSTAILVHLAYSNDIAISFAEAISRAIQEQLDKNTLLYFGTNPREDLPASVCRVKILYCKTKNITGTA